MGLARRGQKIQDWLTQQWVILRGRMIDPSEFRWLVGPFGTPEMIGKDFINHLAEKEKLIVGRGTEKGGLIPSVNSLNLSEAAHSRLSPLVADFYEHTSGYDLRFSVKWNPYFKVFGVLIGRLFSNRLRQLNIPMGGSGDPEPLESSLITLTEPGNSRPKYTFWLRSRLSGDQPVYSGIYGTCVLPSGKTCIKAVFPLPNGNATVIMTPDVGQNGELILESSGKSFGDAGFYFLLEDSKGAYWAHYVRTFRDRLVIRSANGSLSAEQVLTLWGKEVLRFRYSIERKG